MKIFGIPLTVGRMAWLQGLWWDGKFFLNQLIYTELSPEFGKVICSLVKTGPATFFLSFRLTWTQANFIFCCILVSSEVWCDISAALMNSTFQEVHTDLSRSTTVGVSYKNTFLMEINDLKTKKVCVQLSSSQLWLSYRNIFNHFAFLTPFPPSYWSYHGSNPALMEG